MHGGSGLTPADYIECAKRGITKINFATYMFMEGGKYIKETLEKNADKPAEFNTLLKAGIEGQKAIIREHIEYLSLIHIQMCIRDSRKGLPVRGQKTKTNARTCKGPKRTVANKKK